jgi:PAS domain S-box-containing protein
MKWPASARWRRAATPAPSPALAYPRAVKTAAAATCGVGVLVLLGWALDVPALKSVLPGLVTMKANTAVCFVLAGTSLWLLAEKHARWGRAASRACPATLGLIAALTLAEYALGWNARIDEILFRDDPGAVGTVWAGRMALSTALAFLLVGTALGLLGFGARSAARIAHLLAVAVVLFGVAAAAGYAFGVPALYGSSFRNAMALHTALAFIVIGMGTLLLRPDVGFMAIVSADAAGGQVVRRMLPPIIAIPFAAGWLRLLGQYANLYGTEAGTVLTMLASIALLSIVLLSLGHLLNRADRDGRQAARKLAETKDQLQAIVDSTHAAIYMKDLDGRFVFANRGLEAILNLPAERILGKTVYDFFPVEAADEYAANDCAVLTSGASFEEEVVVPLGDGPHLFLTLKVPLRDAAGKVYALCAVSTDITERRLAVEEAQRARADAEAANQELEAFSYSVAHDLRAPLRALDGFSAALVEDYRDRLDGQGVEYLGRVRAGAQHMAQIIDDLLTLSRVSRHEMQSTMLDLTAMAHDVAGRLRGSQPGRKVDFVIQEGISAQGDAHLLELALENLLGNAWKYTGKRPRARIEFGAVIEGESTVYFVRDDGAGFDMAYSQKLFRPFSRLHASHEFEGTGIGLANVQRIVRRHGGRAWATGAPDHGATFFFTLGPQGGKRDRQSHPFGGGQPRRRGAHTPRPQDQQHP